MEHLQVPVVQGGDAGDVTQFALGQELLQIVLACVEIGDGEIVTATVTTVSGVTSESFGWLRRSTKPLGRWNNRSMMRGGSPSPRLKSRANTFSSFGPMPGRADNGANSGLSTGGRIAFS
jgi:hypothetical protein